MEAKQRWQLLNIVIGNRQCGQIWQKVHKCNWQLAHFVLSDVEYLKVGALSPAELTELGESIHMQVQLSKLWHELQYCWNLLYLVPIEAQVAQALELDLTLDQRILIVKR